MEKDDEREKEHTLVSGIILHAFFYVLLMGWKRGEGAFRTKIRHFGLISNLIKQENFNRSGIPNPSSSLYVIFI
jgi:hypothetical protein